MSIVRYGVVAVAVLSCGGWGTIAAAAGPEHDRNTRSSEAFEARHAEHTQRVEVLRIEREYRHRLARLDRLRELAEQQGASDRLAELDELYNRLREQRKEARELCETRHDHRQTNHAERSGGRVHVERPADHRETRPSRRQIRGAARDRAEQRWLEARHETGVKIEAATHMNRAASRLAEKRWREEARDRGAEQRWERAARRSGMLDDVRPSRVSGRHGQREGVGVVRPEDADREFARLRREIGGGAGSRK